MRNLKEEHNKEINELKNEIKNLKEENKKEINELKNDLNKKIEGELLYRLSRDGDQISTFHLLCDNKGPTLTLFETKEGNKGGIYTPLSWDSNSRWKNDMETFIFNLNKNQKYKKLKNDYSIYCNNPLFFFYIFHFFLN